MLEDQTSALKTRMIA